MKLLKGIKMFELAKKKSDNICLCLPKNICLNELSLLDNENSCEIESNFINNNLVCIHAYFGDLIKKTESSLVIEFNKNLNDDDKLRDFIKESL
jgi:hypothetical protein